MAKVWILKSSGRRFHLPVVGNVDVNTRDTAIPVNAVGLRNRAYSGTITIVHPTLGTFSINFDPPGRTGECSQCGLCCTHPPEYCTKPPGEGYYVADEALGVHRCPHLVVPAIGKFGKKDGSYCGIRNTIFETSKGCTLSPNKREPWMGACSFTFEGE